MHGPGFDSVPSKNENQEHFLEVKAACLVEGLPPPSRQTNSRTIPKRSEPSFSTGLQPSTPYTARNRASKAASRKPDTQSTAPRQTDNSKTKGTYIVELVRNLVAHGDAREEKWRGNWRMEWVASTLTPPPQRGISSITKADAHTSAASSRLNWRPHRFQWTCPFRGKTKSGFCACAITFRTSYTVEWQSSRPDWSR